MAWKSADLLASFNMLAARPASDGGLTDDQKYRFLSDAQQYIVDRVASISPKTMYGTPQEMLSSDGGLTYSFGNDSVGTPLMPIGKATIYSSLSSIPGGAWRPGIDYLDEGTQIRLPNNTPFAGPMYWYGVTPVEALTAAFQPVLMPPDKRHLIVIRAVKDYGESGGPRNPELADRLDVRFEREFGIYMTMLRKHFSNGGGIGPLLVPFVPNTMGWSAPLVA
jgi:hypothetical protein